MMMGHRHSTRTPGLLRPAKKPRDFRGPGATETYFTSLAQAWQKGSIFRPKEAHECARTDGAQRGMRNDGEREQKKRAFWRWSNQQTPLSHYERIKKPQDAIRRLSAGIVFRSISYIPWVTSTNCGRLFIPCLYHRFLPSLLWNHPFPSVFFTFTISSFFVLRCFPPSPLPGPDQSMHDFCVDWLVTEGPRSHLWALKRVANIANKKQLTVAN